MHWISDETKTLEGVSFWFVQTKSIHHSAILLLFPCHHFHHAETPYVAYICSLIEADRRANASRAAIGVDECHPESYHYLSEKMERLPKYKELLDQGIIDEEEFEEMKKTLLW